MKILFFKTKVSKEPSQRVRPQKYFEVFGDTLIQLNFFKNLCLALSALSVFLIACLRVALTRPPLVVRVNSLGKVESFKDDPLDAHLTGPELSNFTRTAPKPRSGRGF